MNLELNQFSTVDIVLDKANDNIIQKQFVSVGDKDGRSLTVQITENGAVGEVIGLTLNLRWHNEASGLTDLSAFYVVDKATSVFKIDYPQNMLTPGKVIAYIQILHGGKVTHTKPFEITVQKLAGTTRGVLATAEYSALVTTLAKANEFETDIAVLGNGKVDKGGNEQVTIGMLSQQVKEIMAGANALPVLTENSVNTSNYVDASIIGKKIAKESVATDSVLAFTSEYNLAIPLKFLNNRGFIADGASFFQSYTFISNVIELAPGDTVYAFDTAGNPVHMRAVRYFNLNNSYVDWRNYPPENGKISHFTNNNIFAIKAEIMFYKKGDERNLGVSYKDLIISNKQSASLAPQKLKEGFALNDTQLQQVNNISEPTNTKFVKRSSNLFDASTVIDNVFIGSVAGDYINNEEFYTSQKIAVSAGDALYLYARDKTDVNARKVLFYKSGTIIKFADHPKDAYNSCIYCDGSFDAVRFSMSKNKNALDWGCAAADLMITKTLNLDYESYYDYKFTQDVLLTDNQINQITSSNNLAGKKMAVFGTSISYGHYNQTSYADILSTKYNLQLDKVAYNGATLMDILVQINSYNGNPDVIVFDGGANDNNVSPDQINLGEMTDSYESITDDSHLTGKMERILRLLQTKFVGVPIVFIAVHKMGSRDLKSQSLVTNRFLEVCAKWGCGVVDLFHGSSLNAMLDEYKLKYTYRPQNGTHPNELGYETFYVPQIKAKLLELL